MSRRFRIYSWGAAVLDVLIGSVFLTAHPAMTAPSWYYVFLFIPWQVWSVAFILAGLGMAVAIGSGSSRIVRKSACLGVVLLLVWATEFALVIPSVLHGYDVSWMGIVLVSGLAFFELLYLGMPASRWLDHPEEDVPAEYLIGR